MHPARHISPCRRRAGASLGLALLALVLVGCSSGDTNTQTRSSLLSGTRGGPLAAMQLAPAAHLARRFAFAYARSIYRRRPPRTAGRHRRPPPRPRGGGVEGAARSARPSPSRPRRDPAAARCRAGRCGQDRRRSLAALLGRLPRSETRLALAGRHHLAAELRVPWRPAHSQPLARRSCCSACRSGCSSPWSASCLRSGDLRRLAELRRRRSSRASAQGAESACPDLSSRRPRSTGWGSRARRSSPGSTGSRPASAPTSASPRRAPRAGCSSCPSSWEAFGVDGNGDGIKDPYNPWDAIFAAARLLRASGAPGDWHGAIFTYNHAEWYVAKVLADARRFAGGGTVAERRPRWLRRRGSAPNEAVARMVAEAARLSALRLDLEYVWGGSHGSSPTPPNGPFDCSSAVSHLLQVGGFGNPTMDTIAAGQLGRTGSGALGHDLRQALRRRRPHLHPLLAGVTPPGERYWGTSGHQSGGGSGVDPRRRLL